MATAAIRRKNIPAPFPGASGRDADYLAGIRVSAIAHVALLAIIILKSIVFPGNPTVLVPTLRVDIVGLPDLLKKDLMSVKSGDKLATALKKAESAAKNLKEIKGKETETAAPDEMVLHPKSGGAHSNEKKIKNALARIKALEKISEGSDSESAAPLIKGNQISHGTSLSGDARESAQASYYDLVRDRLQENWALPVWIARQKLSAQIQMYLDPRGRVMNFRFMRVSGNAQFDDAVKKTIQSSQPFPVPPAELRERLMSDGILVGFPL